VRGHFSADPYRARLHGWLLPFPTKRSDLAQFRSLDVGRIRRFDLLYCVSPLLYVGLIPDLAVMRVK
jgi:hypothetical protein